MASEIRNIFLSIQVAFEFIPGQGECDQRRIHPIPAPFPQQTAFQEGGEKGIVKSWETDNLKNGIL